MASLPLPIPSDFVAGIDHQRLMMEGQHPVYLNQQWSVDGFYGYYQSVLLYKLPHVLQLLIVVSLIYYIKKRHEPQLIRNAIFLLLPATVLFCIAA